MTSNILSWLDKIRPCLLLRVVESENALCSHHGQVAEMLTDLAASL